MKRWHKILSGCVLAICTLVFAAYKYMGTAFEFSDGPPLLSEFKSPANLGRASFVRESEFPYNSVYFYVRDPNLGSQPVLIGGPYATDADVPMQNALWSKDGSVIVVRGETIELQRQQLHFAADFFLDAYDFRKHKPIGAGADINQKSGLIKTLIIQRGGVGKTVSPHSYASGGEMSEQEIQQYKR